MGGKCYCDGKWVQWDVVDELKPIGSGNMFDNFYIMQDFENNKSPDCHSRPLMVNIIPEFEWQ
jgi:hypothetical protein